MAERGWDALDFLLVSADAYVDHPSFAVGLIARLVEAEGFRIGVIAQPDISTPECLEEMGRPRYAVLVSCGNVDSMVNHYTSARKTRSDDWYSPGGVGGKRPDRVGIAYVSAIRSRWKDLPVIVGGVEASLRRLAHYDYWTDSVRRSYLLDCKADILCYGMGERPLRELVHRLAAGEALSSINDVRGTCVRITADDADALEAAPRGAIRLPSFEGVKGTDPASLQRLVDHFRLLHANSDPLTARVLVESSDTRFVRHNPPALPLSTEELDAVYELPYTRRSHPMYDEAGGVPALKEVQFSLVANRGCFGGCSFCAITFHQGRAVVRRSTASLIREAKTLIAMPEFKGYIHDVGGPTANFFGPACKKQAKGGYCTNRDCLHPTPCPELHPDHREYLETLRALRALPGVKKVFIRSGIRFDYLLLDARNADTFLEELCAHHVSGQLKVAPEHVSPRVLDAMGKSGNDVYEEFRARFEKTNARLGLKQYLIPYFISSHPGSGLEDAITLALHLKKTRFIPDQAQDFYPTPGSMATIMYRTGIDPRSGERLFVARGEREKRLQRSLIQYDKAENRPLVIEALKAAGREDLIGTAAGCLVPPGRAGGGSATGARARGGPGATSPSGSAPGSSGKASGGRRTRGRRPPEGPKPGGTSRPRRP